MAGDPWLVNNPQVQGFNDVLATAVRACGDIINSVNNTLASMPASVQASGMPLWGDLQLQWTNAYNDMVVRLQGTSTAGQNAHEAYRWGDRQSTSIMM